MSRPEKVLIINGPNMDKLGEREPEIYGDRTLSQINQSLKEPAAGMGVELDFFQSNHEGEIIDKVGSTDADAIIINPAAYTHTSLAIADSLRSFDGPVVEVHMSNIFSREEFRNVSRTAGAADGIISGFGEGSYMMALKYLIEEWG